MSILTIVASAIALALTRGRAESAELLRETPALAAAPALKLRIFYAGLLAAAVAGAVPGSGDAPWYLLLALMLAGMPILGHQTIGLTPARRRSAYARRLWLLGVAFPPLVAASGVALFLDRRG